MGKLKKDMNHTHVNPGVVEESLKAFQAFRKDDAPYDKLFRKISSLHGSMNEYEKMELFSALIQQIEVTKKDIKPFMDALIQCRNDLKWPGLLSEFRSRLHSPRLEIFRKISHAPGGLKFLLDFRGDLLTIRRHSKFDLSPLNSDIIFLFELWFQEGFLYLEEITLDSAYNQIELIKNRDLVHPMASIEEMGRRLGKDRRCFALYHRLLPQEPVIFIEVALTKGLAKNVSQVMAGAGKKKGKEKIDTAIFYSINNTQNGLAGLGLGKMLIGKVVDYLRKENEKIKNFATLSPVPRFWDAYLRPILEGKDKNFALKSKDIISYFPKKGIETILKRGINKKHGPDSFNQKLLLILTDDSWIRDMALKRDLRSPLIKIAYHYIAQEKGKQKKPLNPVAGFHLGNGATVSPKNINFLANPSNKGVRESCGIMVNYIYTSSWLSQVRRSLLSFDRIEIKGLFRSESRRH